MQKQDHTGQNKIIGIIGSKGSGKTVYARAISNQAERVIVVDGQREYTKGFAVSSPAHFIEHVDKGERFRVLFLPLELNDVELACRVARAKQNCLIIIEEIHLYCSPNSTPEHMKRLFLLGRHSKVDIVYTSQRFQDISRKVTSQTDVFVLFRISEPVDLKALDARFGKSLTEQVRNLRDHERIVVDVRKWRVGNERESHSTMGVVGNRSGIRTGEVCA